MKVENLKNETLIREFWILGFENIHGTKIILFILFLISYILTLLANFTIILLFVACPHINAPMYFFLSHLSLNDILLSTTIVPETFHIIMNGGSAISLSGCFMQFYFLSISAANECLLLTVMSYDRYLAICNPLRYSSIMDLKLCILLATSCWVCGVLFALPHIVLLYKMTFCGTNIINHFYCDLVPVLRLSCSDTSANEIVTAIISIPLVFLPLIFIAMTYINIILAILRISTSTGRQKAFSTCSSHLTVVCMYYGTIVFNYMSVPPQAEAERGRVLDGTREKVSVVICIRSSPQGPSSQSMQYGVHVITSCSAPFSIFYRVLGKYLLPGPDKLLQFEGQSTKWKMRFNVDKCKVMHCGACRDSAFLQKYSNGPE
ncbi:olfactory receptor 5V1-like [Spea bombifrons]|uniref:olfactory receptor 5V1-like n=1 Tax=Spea bombifrons TaxID=233779 RepID=UPI00234966B3|nr:olfactory receptor 5V1-like [Spea bombifrons]